SQDLLLLVYTICLWRLFIIKHGLNIVSYATQVIFSLSEDSAMAERNFDNGMRAVAAWIEASRLKLNTHKTEILVIGSTPSIWHDS
ncbi:hypothetical protein NDU88_001813, partial [Pleurodeles waltl]